MRSSTYAWSRAGRMEHTSVSRGPRAILTVGGGRR